MAKLAKRLGLQYLVDEVRRVVPRQLMQEIRRDLESISVIEVYKLVKNCGSAHVSKLSPESLGKLVAYGPGPSDPRSWRRENGVLHQRTPVTEIPLPEGDLSPLQMMEHYAICVVACTVYDLLVQERYNTSVRPTFYIVPRDDGDEARGLG